jgi:hypothetical protein
MTVSDILYSPWISHLYQAVTRGMEELSNHISESIFADFDRKKFTEILQSIDENGMPKEELMNMLSHDYKMFGDAEISESLYQKNLSGLIEPLQLLINNRREYLANPQEFNLEKNPVLRQSATGAVTLLEKWNDIKGKFESSMRISFNVLEEYTNLGFLEMNLGASFDRPNKERDDFQQLCSEMETQYYKFVKTMTHWLHEKYPDSWSLTDGGAWLLKQNEIPFLSSYKAPLNT